MKRTTIAVLGVLALTTIASADLSRGVIANYRGQLVVSKDELDSGKTDKESITKINAARLKTVDGKDNGETTFWAFHYTAFLTKAGSSSLKMDFYSDDAKKELKANMSLSGVDPKNAVLSGEISISEDEGLMKGKSYVVKLENDKDQVVAETKLTFK